ncbi:putative Kinase [Zostera marina]|uniref:non-specific serine/threonine protein kinase n=1 Tax=Zostera marina TaxID=29655 RepID=A0A0K9PL43_ZOSMR|nr:putative Kinase [Zostera marina]
MLERTRQSKLFQSARSSPSSLRYYGIGLENGNYTVTLKFAKIQFTNDLTWKSFGRRVFDIYIQGIRVAKDFEIKKEAGGNLLHSFRRRLWSADFSNQVSPIFIPTVNNQPPKYGSSGKKKALIAGLTTCLATLFIILVIIGLIRRNRKNLMAHQGELSDGKVVAIKKLRVASDHGKESFIAEISAISSVKHRNLVNLYGCCYKDNNRLIVYEYMENGSLDQALNAKSDDIFLDWTTRFSICLGTARGLCYLHEESRYRIIHRDIKSSNILLDFHFNPKISDFGLAKLYEEKMTHIWTRVAGTLGYLALEYAMRGHLTEKADVFSFGIVCLEILSGRQSLSSSDVSQEPILEWAWKLHEKEDIIGMIDEKLSYNYNKEEVLRVSGVALLCTQVNHSLRPSMSRVVSMLVGDIEIGDIPSKSTYMSDWHVDDFQDYKGESFSWGN